MLPFRRSLPFPVLLGDSVPVFSCLLDLRNQHSALYPSYSISRRFFSFYDLMLPDCDGRDTVSVNGEIGEKNERESIRSGRPSSRHADSVGSLIKIYTT